MLTVPIGCSRQQFCEKCDMLHFTYVTGRKGFDDWRSVYSNFTVYCNFSTLLVYRFRHGNIQRSTMVRFITTFIRWYAISNSARF